MRILTLGRLPANEIGGLPLYTANLAEALTALGHECHVVQPGAALSKVHYPFPTHAAEPTLWPAQGRLRTFRQAFSAARALTQLVDELQPDLIHVQYGGAMDLAVLPRLARLGPPLVVTAHCGRAWAHLARAPRVAAKILRSAMRVLVISEDQRELFQSAGLCADKLHVIGSLVEQDFFEPTGARQSVSGRPRKGLYLGRIAPEKGLETVITALASLAPDERPQFQAVGPVSDGYAAHLRLLVGDLELQDSFQLCPPVEGVRTRRDLLDQADFLLHPTHSDVKPLVVIEAMARALPVLASSLPGTIELLAGTGAHFTPGDAAGLAEQLSRLAADPNFLGPKQGLAGQRLSLAYTPAAAAQETAQHFEACAGVLA
ncbi:MAG: glycosyltransferase involved in cell wall biosynthesis [Planctomycetota bacterium]|jgi:glycosyltransferase involved in cell wall biosynthesis